jgi:hypothetical protein
MVNYENSNTGHAGEPPRTLAGRRKTVDAILQRVGRKINIWRPQDSPEKNGYGKSTEDAFTQFVGEELAVLDSSGGGTRHEDPFGESVEWKPTVILGGDTEVKESDAIEFGVPMFSSDTSNNQLWEVETFVPYHTHVEAQLQRVVEQ